MQALESLHIFLDHPTDGKGRDVASATIYDLLFDGMMFDYGLSTISMA